MRLRTRAFVIAGACLLLATAVLIGVGALLIHSELADLRTIAQRQEDAAARRALALDERIAALDARMADLEADTATASRDLRRSVVESDRGTQRAVRGLSSRITTSFSSVQGSISDMGGRIVAALPAPAAASPGAPTESSSDAPANDVAPPSAAAALDKARTLYAQGYFAEAARILAPLAEGKSPVKDVRLYYAASLFHARPDDTANYARVERDLRAVVAEDPRSFVALESLGSLAVERGEWAQGLEWLRGALEENPRDVDVLRKAGACAFSVHDFALARELLDRASALSPGDPDLLFSTGQACVETKDLEGAVTRLNACLSLKPAHLGALLLVASSLHDLGRAAEAEDAWKRALALNEGTSEGTRRRTVDLSVKLARSAWERNDPTACTTYATEGLRAEPSPLLTVYLGMSLRALGDVEQGTRLLRQVVKERSDAEAARLAEAALSEPGN